MEDLRKYDKAPEFTLTNSLKVIQAVATLNSHFKGVHLCKLSEHTTFMKQHVRENYHKF